MTIHDLKDISMSAAYDATQCNSDIKDGDIILVKDGVAVMVEAWPVMAVGASKVFHATIDTFHADTGGKYIKAFLEAHAQ